MSLNVAAVEQDDPSLPWKYMELKPAFLVEIIKGALKTEQRIPKFNARLFTCKSLNQHRCLLVADLSGKPNVTPENIRDAVLKYQHASWFRGMAFSAILEVDSVERASEIYVPAINTKNVSSGTWQWTILHSRSKRNCVGYHTWTRSLTSKIFINLLHHFKADGYQVVDHKLQPQGFLKFATRWTRIGRGIRQYEEMFPANAGQPSSDTVQQTLN